LTIYFINWNFFIGINLIQEMINLASEQKHDATLKLKTKKAQKNKTNMK